MSRYVLDTDVRGADTRKRLFFGTYPGGHMFYLRKKSRARNGRRCARILAKVALRRPDPGRWKLRGAGPAVRRRFCSDLAFPKRRQDVATAFAATMIQMATMPHSTKGTADPSTPKLPP
jgi:hypothetical protein